MTILSGNLTNSYSITQDDSGNTLREKELEVKHPDGEEGFVSISTTVLYDGHHNVDSLYFN